MVFCRFALEHGLAIFICRDISAGSIGAESKCYVSDRILFLIFCVNSVSAFFRIVVLAGMSIEESQKIIDRALSADFGSQDLSVRSHKHRSGCSLTGVGFKAGVAHKSHGEGQIALLCIILQIFQGILGLN